MTKQVVHLRPGDELTVVVEKDDPPAPPPVSESPIPPGSKVIDVSVWQGDIDWGAVRNVANVRYAMIRAVNGTVLDKNFKTNWRNANSLVRRGAYHYWQNEIGAHAQAQAFIEAHNGDWGELPWALDIEDQQPPFTKAELGDIRTFLSLVEAVSGKRGYIYTGASVWKFPDEAWATDYQLWLAAYNTVGYKPLAPWPHPCIWQHSSRGVIPGITANTVDLNTTGDGLTPIKPDWYWRGCTTETKIDGVYKENFFVRALDNPIAIYDAPDGKILLSLPVTWKMTVSAVTTDGWLKVHRDGTTDWWVRAGDVSL